MDPIIKQVADYIKKYPSPISELTRLAQFVLETGAGKSQLFKVANNDFGIKASAPWQGEVTQHLSPEGANSQIMVKSGFRKYPSIEASVRDHASFFESTEKRKDIYARSIYATTLQDEMNGLQGTYAGDLSYGSKLMKVVDEYDLRSYFEDGGTSKFRKSEGGTKLMKMTIEQAFKQLGLKFTADLLPLRKTYGKVNRKQGIVLHQTGAPSTGSNAQAMANHQRKMSKPNNYEQKS